MIDSLLFWTVTLATSLAPHTVQPYDHAYADGYCHALADRGHGWDMSDIVHDRTGFTCLWSVPKHDRAAHHEYCSDEGGVSYETAKALVCTRHVAWPVGVDR